MIIFESKVYQVQNPNVDNISLIKIIKNPTKTQINTLLQEDRYHIIRAFVLENDLYCWRSFCLTHKEAKEALLRQEGIDIQPLCGIVLNNKYIQLANTWNSNNITQEDKIKILSNPQLEYLFGKNYNIIDL